MTEGRRRGIKRTRVLLAAWGPAALWMVLIFALSSLSGLETGFAPSLDWALRKLAHSLVYAVLAALFWRALRRTTSLAPPWIMRLSFCLAVLYAVTDEVHQRFVPGRFGAWWDVAIDAFGAAAAWVILERRSRGS
jgi:VanZ family protein